MLRLDAISTENVLIFKEVRLRALSESPMAFGSTYARESQLTDEEWLQRAARNAARERMCGFLAMDGDACCGLVGGALQEDRPEIAWLLSMWVQPEYRQRGAGRLLVNAVRAWAASKDVQELRLMVTSSNGGALAFYQQIGFTKTGATEPYPNDPGQVEYEMAQTLR